MLRKLLALFRSVFRIAVITIILLMIPAMSNVPAQKLEYRLVPVVAVTHVPGKDMSDRLVTVNLGKRTHRVRTRERQLSLEPGGTACLAERTLMRDHWVIYSLRMPEMCRRI